MIIVAVAITCKPYFDVAHVEAELISTTFYTIGMLNL